MIIKLKFVNFTKVIDSNILVLFVLQVTFYTCYKVLCVCVCASHAHVHGVHTLHHAQVHVALRGQVREVGCVLPACVLGPELRTSAFTASSSLAEPTQ